MTILSCYVGSAIVARMDGDQDGRQWSAPSDEQLIAWHGEELSGQELAAREGLAVKWIYRQWDRLRRAGLIARGGRLAGLRPTSVKAAAVQDGDGRPRVGWYDDDPLLARLMEFHGEGGRADLVDLRWKKKEQGSGGTGGMVL